MADRPVVIITGASRGIGAAAARWLGKTGAGITLLARTAADLEKTADGIRRLGGDPLVFPGDVSGWEFCQAAVEKTVETFGAIDAVINNAGILAPLAPVQSVDVEAWRYSLLVNVAGPFYLAKAALLELRKTGGKIVNVSSGAARIPIAGASAYCTAKAALTHFTRVLAAEENYLTAVAVRPGVVDTDMQAMLRRQGPGTKPPDRTGYYRRLKAEKKLEPPVVPARSIAWLALAAPRSMSGEFVNYDDDAVMVPATDMFGEKFPER